MSDTLFTVWELDHEEQTVLSVWSNEEDALAEVERAKAWGYSYGYEIKEYVLNRPYVTHKPGEPPLPLLSHWRG